MRVAVYVRVSTQQQTQTQTIEQQIECLQAHSRMHGWEWQDQHVFRDDGYSGASLKRPGLDRLRDHVALANFDLVVITAPDRLARKYVHQLLLIEEFEKGGCQVEFVDRPMSQDPHDQLLLQIRGVVAEYERNLIDLPDAAWTPSEIPGRNSVTLEQSPLRVRRRPGSPS